MNTSLKRGGLASLCCAALVLVMVGCGGGGGGDASFNAARNNVPDPAPAPVQASALVSAVASSPVAAVLPDCVSASTAAESCSLETLPLIGQTTANPAIANIMQRTVVSHPWMAENWREVLSLLPDDLRLLMRSVTAVVIGSDIRPSYFSSATGAIYLDPYYLWQTNAEKATIAQAEDFRVGFGDALEFVSLARYVSNDEPAWPFYDLNGSETRTAADLVLPLAALLYHELAHANDFFPASRFAFLEAEDSALEASTALFEDRISVRLDNDLPLASDLWMELGAVLYQGATASAEQRDLSASLVGQVFQTDGASDDYAYSSIYEDVAMLFEEAMMAYHFGVQRDIAFVDRPAEPVTDCNDYRVAWGQRSRIRDPLVQARGEFVVTEILGAEAVDDVFSVSAMLGALEEGAGWCNSVQAGRVMATSVDVVPSEDVSVEFSHAALHRFRFK